MLYRYDQTERKDFMKNEKLIVIIPAYEPPREFIDYAKNVAGFAKELVVVNDGSSAEYDDVFNEIEKIENVKYITYGENHGKGYALKEAFRYCSEAYGEGYVCVTADCDGQHDAKDIKRVAAAAAEHPKTLVLGSRNFDLPCVPKRSRAGNTNIRRLFKLLYGIDLADTQTGLRGFSVSLAEQFLSVRGNRFEFEMEMLIYAKKKDISVLEVPIETIYPEDPKDHVSHFKTFKDSMKIVGTVVKNLNLYLFVSLVSGILDVLVFFVLSSIVLGEISAVNTLIATVSARVASSLLNFFLNRKYVFAGKTKKSIYRYYILWFCQLGASYGLVFVFGNLLRLPMTPMKLAGDLILAFFSYQIQKLWVFKNDDGKHFYGPFVRFIIVFAKLFTKKCRSSVVAPEEPTVYVCRHLNMRGPLTTIIRLGFHVHPMILSCFFDKNDCYRQYAEFTFTERAGKKKKKHSFKAYAASRVVPRIMKSLKAIPVYRGADANSMQTMRDALSYLEKNESVIVYPDTDYTAGYEKESEIYEGFLLLGQLYKRNTGKSLRFVPLYIDDERKSIIEARHITIDNFSASRAFAYDYIKASINGREVSSEACESEKQVL